MRSIGARFQPQARLLATRQAGAELRQSATQWTQQQAVADQELLAGQCAVIIEAVAGQFFADGRVEGHVQQAGTVLQVAEVTGFDEAGARVVTLVTEDAVHLQRVADRFVNLQHHLVGHQQQVARATGRIRGQQQLQDLVRPGWRRPPGQRSQPPCWPKLSRPRLRLWLSWPLLAVTPARERKRWAWRSSAPAEFR